MAEEDKLLTQPQLRSPRSAAFAGILFALMRITSLILVSSAAVPADFSRDWLENWSRISSVVLLLVPFSGIAFLWFTGVIRDRIGDREDRFFATIFFGSGILYVGMGFVWAAIMGAIFGIYAAGSHTLVGNDIYIFGFAIMNEMVGNYTLRMSGVYMTAIGTLWTKTGVMPRWLTIGTYILAFGFLFFGPRILAARFLFPAWVFVVSVYILVLNYRRTHDQEGTDGLSLDD